MNDDDLPVAQVDVNSAVSAAAMPTKGTWRVLIMARPPRCANTSGTPL
jgi:hypothetical protein